MPADWVVAAVTTPPVGPGGLEVLLRRLLPTALVQTPPPHPDTHGNGDFAGTPTVRSAGTEADTTASDWDDGNGNIAAAPASGNASSGLSTGSSSPGLDYDSVCFFLCGKLGHRVRRCPELNETIPYMLPGWSAEKVGVLHSDRYR